MSGICDDCALCRPNESRWTGTYFGCGCVAKEDGIHEIGWGNTLYDKDGKIERTDKGLIKVSKCYYWKPKEIYEQLNLNL